jgi:hypothetical protein
LVAWGERKREKRTKGELIRTGRQSVWEKGKRDGGSEVEGESGMFNSCSASADSIT